MSILAPLMPKLREPEPLTLVPFGVPDAGLRPVYLLHLRGRTVGRHRLRARQGLVAGP